MIASVYIKDGNIHYYNEEGSASNIGGLAYELGRPLLDFVCYDPKRIDESFLLMTEAFNDEFAHIGIRTPEFLSEWTKMMTEFQQGEIYVSIYGQIFMEFLLTFVDSPQRAIENLARRIPIAEDVFFWAWNLKWPAMPNTPYTQVAIPDKEKRLYRAAKDFVTIMSEDFREKQTAMSGDIRWLLKIRKDYGTPKTSSLEYLYTLEKAKLEYTGLGYYLEKPLLSFYGTIKPPDVVELYEINTIDDLLRFEFIKMIERDIFIKKCQNCGHFFMPRRRADAEYCERIMDGSARKCSEIGALRKYERKVAGNPILEAYSKAYKRFNSRTRAKKMTQTEFLNWSEEARKLRSKCEAGELPFEEFVAWLEQGRIRKNKNAAKQYKS